MQRLSRLGMIAGIVLIVGAASVLAWWFTRQPEGIARLTKDYPWRRAVINVDGKDIAVEYSQFGTGVPVEIIPYWKQPAKTPEDAAASEVSCLGTGGSFSDLVGLYSDPERAREFLLAKFGSESAVIESQKKVRRALLLGKLKCDDLWIVVIKAAVNDSADPWVTTGRCYVEKDGRFYALIEKPKTPLMKWLSQNEYMLKTEGASK